MPPQQGWERDGLTGTEDVGVHHEHAHTHARARAPHREGSPGPGRWLRVDRCHEAQPLCVLHPASPWQGTSPGCTGANVVGETWAGEAHVHGAHPWERRGPRGIPTLGCRQSLLPLTNEEAEA